MAKVSVIMPTYNRAKYLSDAISSVLNQTYQDFEIIVVDDGSTDNTRLLVENYQKMDNRIRYFYEQNRGVASARNLGIEKAQGDYMVFFDSDDVSMPDRLEKQVMVLDSKPEISLVYSSVVTFFDNNPKGSRHGLPIKTFMSTQECFRTLVMEGCFIYNPTILFRKSIVSELLYDEEMQIGEDYLFFLQASQKFLFYGIEEPLVRVRRGHNSLVRNEIGVSEANEIVMDKLFKSKNSIFGLSYKKCVSMMHIHNARAAMYSRTLKNHLLIYCIEIAKSFLIMPLNIYISKNIIGEFCPYIVMLSKTLLIKFTKSHLNVQS